MHSSLTHSLTPSTHGWFCRRETQTDKTRKPGEHAWRSLSVKNVALACPRLRDVLVPASCGRPSLAHRYSGHEDDAVDTLLFSAANEETAGYYGGTGMRVSLVYLPVFLVSFLTMFVVRRHHARNCCEVLSHDCANMACVVPPLSVILVLVCLLPDTCHLLSRSIGTHCTRKTLSLTLSCFRIIRRMRLPFENP